MGTRGIRLFSIAMILTILVIAYVVVFFVLILRVISIPELKSLKAFGLDHKKASLCRNPEPVLCRYLELIVMKS